MTGALTGGKPLWSFVLVRHAAQPLSFLISLAAYQVHMEATMCPHAVL